MPQKVHDCVQSVLDDNPGMDESKAWAICQDQFDAASGELGTLDDLGVDAEALDKLASEGDEWQSVTGGWINEQENLAIHQPGSIGTDGVDQQAGDFAADVFRIVQAEDSDMGLDGDLMGVGVDFPNAGVYVDWRIDAWPDGEQLDEPHVSDYGSIEDLEQATGGVVEHIETVDATDSEVVDGEAPAAPTDSQSADE